MADAVDSLVTLDDGVHYGIRLTAISDGTGETNVIKVDKSAIVAIHNKKEPAAVDLLEVQWSIQGFASVTLLWDHATDSMIDVLAGNGYRCYDDPLKDPKALPADGAGDVLLTSNGAISGASYDLHLLFRLRPVN